MAATTKSTTAFPVGRQTQLPAATAEAIRPTSPQADTHASAPRAGEASASSAAPRPTLATITRYPALAGCPDLTNHLQVVEAISYHDLALRLSKRARWTRAERAAIAAATAKVVADARASHQAALAIWSEIATARGMQMLSDAQDAAIAAQDRAA